MMTDIKNISAINADLNMSSLARNNSSLKIKHRDRSANSSKTATFDLNNLSKIIPVSASMTNKHHTSSSALHQSTTSLNKAGTRTVEARIPPFIPPGKTVKKHSYVDSSIMNYDNEKATLYSTWTPLSDDKANQKLFEERKQLFVKWFETWSDSQRRMAIEEMFMACKPKQLFYSRDVLNKISPVYQIDFTRVLPRVICLYIMSFLDPRSLSRCAQVCWYWKMLAESDQLWMPKCLRFGWNLNYIPSSFESGIWKQFYIENIKALQYAHLKKSMTPAITDRSEQNLHDLANGRFGFNNYMNKSFKNSKHRSAPLKHPPWKGNSFNPNHLYRYNYLDVNPEEEANAKRADRLMKTLALDSSIKQTQQAALRSQQHSRAAQHQQQQQEEELHNQSQSIQTPTSANNFRNAALATSAKVNIRASTSQTAVLSAADVDASNQELIDNILKKGETLINQINLNSSKLHDLQSQRNQISNKTSELMVASSLAGATVGGSNRPISAASSSATVHNTRTNLNIWKLLDANLED